MSDAARRQIEAFLAAAEELHFGHTGERLPRSTLHISQLVSVVTSRRRRTSIRARSFGLLNDRCDLGSWSRRDPAVSSGTWLPQVLATPCGVIRRSIDMKAFVTGASGHVGAGVAVQPSLPDTRSERSSGTRPGHLRAASRSSVT